MLKRFTNFEGLVSTMARCLVGVSLLAVMPAAMATYPAVVASSTAAYANSAGFGYINKLVVDPSGNIFVTDSSNGALWEIAVGTTTPIRISNFVFFASVSNAGSGFTSTPTVTISAPPAGGTTATAVAVLGSGTKAGTVTGITMTNQGSGYTSAPTVTISGGGGSGATGTASISLNSTHGLTVDKYGDVFVSSGSGGNLYFFPNNGGTLSTTSNAAGIEPLDILGTNGVAPGLDDYYGVVSDTAIDGSGNLYLAMSACNNSGSNICGTSKDSIFLIKNITNATTATTIGVAGNASLFIGSLPGGKAALNIAVDNNGHLYYVDGTNAYVVSTTSGANPVPTVLGSGFKGPSGISVDAAGNVYIVDNSTKLLSEIPNENGTLNPADQFIVASLTNPYYSIGFDPSGNILQADGTDKVINKITLGALNVPTVAVGGIPPSTGVVNFRFNAVGSATVTPTAVSLVQGIGSSTEFQSTSATTCTANTAYISGGSCAVTISFSPASTGVRRGAIVLRGAGNTALATAYLSGTGSGAGLTADPGTQTALAGKTAWVTPGAVAMDAAGNTYVADAGANTIQVISAGGVSTASIGSNLSGPRGVTVDGAGNVFIADTGNNRIVEVPNEAGTLNTVDQFTVLPSLTGLPGTVGLNKPLGIFAGSDGALYVADSGNARVLRYSTFDGLGSLIQSTVGSGYTQPVAVTTDGLGNVFVADATPGQIDQFYLPTGTQTVALAGLSTPSAISLDASGALYVVNSGTNSLSRYPNVSGVFQTSSALLLGTNLSTPAGVAVNGAGNVAVTDDGAPAVGTSGQLGYVAAVPPTTYSLVRTAGTVYFGSVNTGLSFSQNFTLTSMGSATATLGTPAYTASGATADYSVTNGTCANGTTLTVGASCTYTATLTPVVTSGTLNEQLSFNSNAVNTGTVSETLTGVATNLSVTTTTLQLVTSANPVYGQTVTVTATVASQAAGATPTGYVTFSLDGISQEPNVRLPANCSSTVPCTVSYTFTTRLSVATHAINARYFGDASNSASNATSAITLTVAKQPTTTKDVPNASDPTRQPFITAPIVPLVPGSSVYFVVSTSPTITGTPTGTFSLVATGTSTPLASAPLSATGTAVIKYAPSTTPGSYSYQVIYSGDNDFVGSTSSSVTVQISNPTYTVTLPSTAYTVADGSSVTVPMTITGIAGYAGNVTLGGVNVTTGATTAPCVGLPQYVTCTFTPGIVALTNGLYPYSNAVQVINLTLSTSVPPASPYGGAGFLGWPGGLAALFTLLAITRRRCLLRTRLLSLALLTVLGGLMAGLSGCGNGRGSSPAYVTPKGASTITVNFSGSPTNNYTVQQTPNIPNATSFQLTVQ
jgi:sugar lactone lactonase YvrE